MRASISITTPDGLTYEGTVSLSQSSGQTQPTAIAGKRKRTTSKNSSPASETAAALLFGLPIRPFIKRFSSGMSGPKRFVLMVAHAAKGQLSVEVDGQALQKQWSKMSALMGGDFNTAYPSRARDNAWIESPKAGVFVLLGEWKEILQ
jgi:hypothetical protein